MPASTVRQTRIAPSASSAAALTTLLVDEYDCDKPRVALPRPEVQVVARFGGPGRGGLDVHVLGVREQVHRKLVRGGQRTASARLRLGAHASVLGVPASEVVGRVVALEDVWGRDATERLIERLARARDTAAAAAVLDAAIAERVARADARRAPPKLALEAAARLPQAPVRLVASQLGVSERHLRRVFHLAIGMSPKTFARLTRFRHAVKVARAQPRVSWAGVAAAAGYYDQAHLIADFRAIAATTPRALLDELRA